MSEGEVAADVLVVGGGMGGMTAGAFAARHGKVVIVVEKGEEIGGSTVISGGGLWTAPTFEALREVNPLADPELGRLLVDHYDELYEWIAGLDVELGPKLEQPAGSLAQSISSVFAWFDTNGYVDRCRSEIVGSGGWVLPSVEVKSLIMEEGGVRGARVLDRDGEAEVRAPWTILATGGFQANAELRKRYIGDFASDLLVRSNPRATGDGLQMALAAGADTSAHMDGFYGHTVPSPISQFEPQDYHRFAQYYLSPRSVLLDRNGKRFVDESEGYYLNAQAVAAQLPDKRALLVFDENVHQQDMHAVPEIVFDRVAEAESAGAHVARAGSGQELERLVEAWGFTGVAVALTAFNAAIRHDPEALIPARRDHRIPVLQTPFHAIEVQPAITFTQGGIRVDLKGRALRPDGKPIRGLLVAGVDAGGVFHRGYGGGLAFSGVLGLQAARTAIGT